MAYEKVKFKDYPNKTTPVNANNLNHMDDQIYSNAEEIEGLKSEATKCRTMYKSVANINIDTTSTATLSEVIDLMDEMSEVTFFVSSSRYTGVYAEILAGVQSAYPSITSIGAHVTIRKNGTTAYITVEDYGEPSNKFGTIYRSGVADNWVKFITTSDTESRRFYHSPSNFGCSSSDTDITLQKMIEAMDAKSSVSFWIGSWPTIRKEVIEGLSKLGVTSTYGVVTIDKSDSTAHITYKGYSSPATYVATYSTVNSTGWSEWEKLATGPVGEYVSTTYAEVGYNDNIVVGATICMQKLSSSRCNLHISYKIAANDETDTTIFYFLSSEKIMAALGVSALNADASQSQVIFIPVFEADSSGNLTINTAENSIGLMGLSGIHATINATGVQMGRIYKDDGSYGSWSPGAYSDSLFKVNTYGQINFYGALYSL